MTLLMAEICLVLLPPSFINKPWWICCECSYNFSNSSLLGMPHVTWRATGKTRCAAALKWFEPTSKLCITNLWISHKLIIIWAVSWVDSEIRDLILIFISFDWFHMFTACVHDARYEIESTKIPICHMCNYHKQLICFPSPTVADFTVNTTWHECSITPTCIILSKHWLVMY